MVRFILIFCALFAFAACDARFSADFEGEQIGAPPPSSPPGLPNGDQIVLFNSGVAGNGTMISVTDNPDLVPGDGAHRFLSMDVVANPGESPSMNLRSSEFASSFQPLFLVSDQVLVGLGTAQIQFYELESDPSERSFCRIITGNDYVTASCQANVDAQAVSKSIEGFDSQSPHRLVLRIERPAGPVRMTVGQDGIDDQSILIAAPGLVFPGEGERLNVPVFVEGAVGSGYRLNSVIISERDPG